MTTIATDGKTIAADSRTTGGYTDEAAKLFRVKGSVYGVSGDLAAVMAFIDWRKDRRKPKPELEDSYILEINRKGIWFWDKSLRPVQCARKIAAIGSGADFAMAAMHLGKTPEQAVAVACEFDPFSSPPIIVEKL